MNNTVTITKAQILEAIAEEPLAPKHWAWEPILYSHNDPVADEKDCNVCAVGAVMRRVMRVPTIRGNTGYLRDVCAYVANGAASDWRYYLGEKEYLTALSARFEGLGGGLCEYDLTKVRAILSAWVTEEFPDSFEQDINGFLPLASEA